MQDFDNSEAKSGGCEEASTSHARNELSSSLLIFAQFGETDSTTFRAACGGRGKTCLYALQYTFFLAQQQQQQLFVVKPGASLVQKYFLQFWSCHSKRHQPPQPTPHHHQPRPRQPRRPPPRHQKRRMKRKKIEDLWQKVVCRTEPPHDTDYETPASGQTLNRKVETHFKSEPRSQVI